MEAASHHSASVRKRLLALRIAWSVLWGLAASLLVALWVRSYSTNEAFGGPLSTTSSIEFASADGSVYVTIFHQPKAQWWTHTYGPGKFGVKRFVEDRRSLAGFKIYAETVSGALAFRGVLVPYWALVAMCGAIGALSRRSWRFTIRTLLVCMTLIAMGLGLLLWSVS